MRDHPASAAVTLPGSGCTASEGDFAGYEDRALRLHSHLSSETLSTSVSVTTDSRVLRVATAQRFALPDDVWVVALGERLPDSPPPRVVFLSNHRGEPGHVVEATPVGRVTWVAESRAWQVDTVLAVQDDIYVSCAVTGD